jgi:hypothetical protein
MHSTFIVWSSSSSLPTHFEKQFRPNIIHCLAPLEEALTAFVAGTIMSSSVGSADRPSDNDEDAIKVISPDDGEERMEGERERERERGPIGGGRS